MCLVTFKKICRSLSITILIYFIMLWFEKMLENTTTNQKVTLGMSKIVMENYISDLVSRERTFIKEILEKYPTLKIKQLSKSIMETGGRPKSSLLISTWRSGSGFVGQILHSHPVNHYNYEPLHQYGIKQLRSGQQAEEAVCRSSSAAIT